MKEKIKDVLRQIPIRHRSRIVISVTLLGLGVIPTVYWLTAGDQKIHAAEETATMQNVADSRIAVVGEESTTSIGNVGPSNSWPGEIVSSEISQIQPQREGVIVEWRVRVGERVSAGQVMGRISSPPATPELIKMLAEQTEAVTRAKAQAGITDDYISKEQARLSALRDSIGNSENVNADLSLNALKSLREKVEVKKQSLRSFVERTLTAHVARVTNYSDWRYVQYGMLAEYGSTNQKVRNAYQTTLLALVDVLKNTDDVPLDAVSSYFDLAIRLANSTPNDMVGDFKTMTSSDQSEFLEFVSEYKDAQTEVADKETEYKIMISEKVAMLERDRSMAQVDAQAAAAAYKTVSNEITGGAYIYAPRSGSVSAIYKKVGDLVGPEMSVAVVAGHGTSGLLVRMRIPSNIRKPAVGDSVSVVRPGFPTDVRKAKMLGVGISLDETGSYMADALLLDPVDWPVEASVRVIASSNTNTPTVPLSSVWWDEAGISHVWRVSDADRLFRTEVVLGRTLGTSIEVYRGLKNGDRYILRPSSDMQEDMVLPSNETTTSGGTETSVSDEHGGHGDM
ncbi:MAG: hypothetical protein AAB442_00475 [Patescibacteria group bacterium]